HFISQYAVMGQCHTAFGGSDNFDRMKAEYGDIAIEAIAHRLIMVTGAHRMRGIFNYTKTKFVGQIMYLLHITAGTGQMYWYYDLWQCISAACLLQLLPQFIYRHIAAVGFDVDKIDICAAVTRAIG